MLGLHLALRAGKEHRNLRYVNSQISINTDSQGRRFLRYREDSSKTDKDGVSTTHRQVPSFNRNDERCWICSGKGHMARNCRSFSRDRPRHTQNSSNKATTTLVKKELHYVTLENVLKLPVNKDGDKIYVKSVGGKQINLVAFSRDLPDNLPVQSGCIHGFDGQVQVLRNSGCSGLVIRRSVSSRGIHWGSPVLPDDGRLRDRDACC